MFGSYGWALIFEMASAINYLELENKSYRTQL
jgi:hypothetical protein